MPLITGGLSARMWRVTDTLPPNFTGKIELDLKRHAFRPTQPEKGVFKTMGWVNVRQPLDARLTANKVVFDGLIALALRVDRITINQRLFRATVAEEVVKALREQKARRMSAEQRQALEGAVRDRLLKAQPPAMAVHEIAWHLESGLVIFGATGDSLNAEFADLFGQTFGLSIEPQFPYLRAQRWAKRQRVERELLELMPAPFSPLAPAEVIVMDAEAGEG